MTENEMVGGHHQINGRESEQTLGDSEGQGSLVCYSPWDHSYPRLTAQFLRPPCKVGHVDV